MTTVRNVVVGMVGAVSAVAGLGATHVTAGSTDPVEVTFWNGFTGPDRATVEALVQEFNDSQDDVEVKMDISPWDQFFQRLLPALGSGDGPDLVGMDAAQLPQYAERGVLRPLDDYYADAANETDALVQAAVDAGVWDGVAYGVPMNFTTLMLYWNKTMFEEAGLDPESPPTTWDEFIEAAKTLTGDGTYGLALGDHETVPMWPILLWGNGGGVVSDDGTTSMLADPATIEALDLWGGLVRDEGISPIGLTGADADKLFQTGRAAMEIVGPWMTTGFTEAGLDYGVAAVPEGPAGPVTLGTSVAFAVTTNADDEQAAAAEQFMAFWNSTESQVTWALGSGFPPNRTDIDEAALADNPFTIEFGRYADTARFYLQNVAQFTKVDEEIFQPALQMVLNGEGTAEEILTDASAELQGILDE